jgi:hypothetical protein
MATYLHTFTSGDTLTPTKLNNARTATDIVNADIKSDAAIAGTKIDPLVAVGTYTPTITGVTNVASVTASECQYTRVGSVVTVSGTMTVGFTVAGDIGELTITLPVASTFSGFGQCGGTLSINTTSTARGYGAFFGAISETVARARIYATNAAARDFSIHFSYRII